MENELSQQIAAVRAASELGCFGAHQVAGGAWMPCSSTKQFLSLTIGEEVKSRMSLDDMRNWSSVRKAKGKKRKKRWEKLRERRILGIDSLEGGGLVSGNSRTSANAISGGSIPPMTYGNVTPPNMSTKSIQPAFMPRDNDPDVFIDIESARKRAQQLGCIGVSRRMSKGGKTVWMPCTNLTDYNNLTGMTSLGRLNQAKRNDRVVRTVIKDELKRRKKSIPEEILGKSLGPKLRGVARAITDRFDPNALDGDNDGLLQDSTPFERPNVPNANIPKTPKLGSSPEKDVEPKAIASIKKWISSLSPKEKEDFRSEPIEAFDVVPGLASRSYFGGDKTKPQSVAKPAKPVSIDGLDNPEASPTNPFRNLGGRAIGQVIRGLVEPKNRGKKDRKTYIVGGNTGSGKSTVLDSHLIPQGLVPSESEAAIIDPDFVKKALPGYDDGAGAGRVHGQSQTVTDKIIRDSADEGLDMVITGSGASRQLTHIREAKARGESVVGHWVHVPQKVASQRIKKRMDQDGRFIPDNTAHMAASIPRTISSAFEEDLLDEFYLWDNDIAEGAAPKLIAKKTKGNKFEIFDQAKFEEFAGDKKWADRWVAASERNDSKIAGAVSSASKKPSSGGLSSSSGISVKQDPIFVTEAKKVFDRLAQEIKDSLESDNQGKKLGPLALVMKRSQLVGKVIENGVYRKRYISLGRDTVRSDFQINSVLRIPDDVDQIVDFYVPEKEKGETQLDFARRLLKFHPSVTNSFANNPNLYPIPWGKNMYFDSPEELLAHVLDSVEIDTLRIKSLRKALKNELLNNEAFAETVKEFGLPLHLPVKKEPSGGSMDGTNGYHFALLGFTAINAKILKDYSYDENHLVKVTGGNKITVGGLIRHEYGHHLDAVAIATDPVTAFAQRSITQASIDDLFDNTRDRLLRAMGTLDEMLSQFEYSLNTTLPNSQKQIFQNMPPQQKAQIFYNAIMHAAREKIGSMMNQDHGGLFTDRGRKLTPYAAWSASEFFAETVMSITATAKERARSNSGFGEITQDVIDFLTEYSPGLSESFWRTIAKINGIEIA